MATARQIHIYDFHRRNCQRLGIAQGTLKHKGLQGSLGTPSSTGNVLYTPPVPDPAGPTTSDTAVWLVTAPVTASGNSRVGESLEIGREGMDMLNGQIPAIDDNSAAVTIAHDDLMLDMAGVLYRILSPTITPDNSLWSFGMVKEH